MYGVGKKMGRGTPKSLRMEEKGKGKAEIRVYWGGEGGINHINKK